MEHNSTLLSQLASGEVILGDGSYIMTLERGGYAKAGQWAPEAAAEHPLAVEQLVVELSRTGADITQTFTFWCHQDSLPKGCKYLCDQINQAACDIATKVSKTSGTIVAGWITQSGIFDKAKPNKKKIQEELTADLEILVKNDIKLIICEYFRNILELEWAIEVALDYGLPVGATMGHGSRWR